jgi:hypothetical protein
MCTHQRVVQAIKAFHRKRGRQRRGGVDTHFVAQSVSSALSRHQSCERLKAGLRLTRRRGRGEGGGRGGGGRRQRRRGMRQRRVDIQRGGVAPPLNVVIQKHRQFALRQLLKAFDVRQSGGTAFERHISAVQHSNQIRAGRRVARGECAHNVLQESSETKHHNNNTSPQHSAGMSNRQTDSVMGGSEQRTEAAPYLAA